MARKSSPGSGQRKQRPERGCGGRGEGEPCRRWSGSAQAEGEAQPCLACLGDSKKASVAGTR